MLPQAFLDRIRQQLGPEYEAFLASYDRPRALGLRLNPLKTSRFPTLPFPISPLPWAAHGFWYPPEARPGLHPWHEAGLYYLQEPSAMAPAELLGVEPELAMIVTSTASSPFANTLDNSSNNAFIDLSDPPWKNIFDIVSAHPPSVPSPSPGNGPGNP